MNQIGLIALCDGPVTRMLTGGGHSLDFFDAQSDMAAAGKFAAEDDFAFIADGAEEGLLGDIAFALRIPAAFHVVSIRSFLVRIARVFVVLDDDAGHGSHLV